ncbi:signal peptidase II [Lipingzhangella sp. LS1_29]|uniref:Lipoprotein signal peptidase n=1 Tax=Lipingzhangella rawalii TaxID=2055835 RepID=A0ABU2H3F6_9ACTN|nr:signal peptidase II [Lipingzhangella rawalii]MDS1269385.1 signal peptidase II [Lipingzhangella rawalii]
MTNPDPAGDYQTVSQTTPAPPRRLTLFAVLAATALCADFVTKEIALASFSPEAPVELFGGLLTLTLTFNDGAAFSIGQGMPWLFGLIAIAVMGYILWLAWRLRDPWWAVALGLILGGAAGNLVDRLIRAPVPLHGAVVDWIQVPNWPVFNIADSAIVCGGVLAVWLAFRGRGLDGQLESTAARQSSESRTDPSEDEQ